MFARTKLKIISQSRFFTLVDAGDLLSTPLVSVVESESSDSLSGSASANLERLDEAGNSFVGHGRVLAFGVLSDADNIEILVSGIEGTE